MITNFQSMSQSKQMAEYSVHLLPGCSAQIKDCWLVIDGRALNDTRCLEEHPGGEEVLIESADAQVASIKEPKKKEMSALVIKDDSMPKYASIVEMFLPLLVAGSYFSYRYLTTASSMV
ncbi:hypothetical protein PVK06_015709 [Gossypium arboreum]|uniref:Cytochrome b5 heme-binding domain-containing protein n=1 Tax=Gossypium arboreum TaxID=29729 RepID=A0ABR0PY06_GOSAR|nr:hypothetical protein PVK06_015709 [Gossypium arboreum]